MTDKLAGRAVLGLLLILVLAVPAYARIDCYPCDDAQPARVLPPTPTKTATAAPTMELAPKAVGPTTWQELPPTAQPPADYPPPEPTQVPDAYPTHRWFQDTATPYPSLAPDERATLQAGPTPTPPLPEG